MMEQVGCVMRERATYYTSNNFKVQGMHMHIASGLQRSIFFAFFVMLVCPVVTKKGVPGGHKKPV